MSRINTTNAVVDMHGPGKNGFRDGNKAQGVLPTELSAAWCNFIQESPARVIEAAGLEMSDDPTLLLQAIQNMIASTSIPAGKVTLFAASTAPTGYLKANGAAISRTAYAQLFAAIGTTYGAGDGTTTFNVPDLRGEFLRAWDDGRGVDAGRVLGTWQKGTISANDIDGLTDILNGSAAATNPQSGIGTVGLDSIYTADYPDVTGIFSSSITTNSPATRPELYGSTRPRNVAVLVCIKY